MMGGTAMVDADASQEGSGSWELTGGMVMVEWLVVADLSAQDIDSKVQSTTLHAQFARVQEI